MKKSILCLLLALCLCLCMILAACNEETPDPNDGTTPPAGDETPAPETGDESGKKGQIHYTEDTTGSVENARPNEQLPDSTIAY